MADVARAYTEGLNPLKGTLTMPPDPESTHAALAPFLDHRRLGAW
jgi:hypothetical protein